MTFWRSRLKLRLVASYLLLGACTTTVNLGVGRWARQRTFAVVARHAELLDRAEKLSRVATASAEEGFSYLLVSDARERALALTDLATADGEAQALHDGSDLSDDERRQLAIVLVGVGDLRRETVSMFESHELTNAVPLDRYRAYDDAVDQLLAHLAEFVTLVRAENERVDAAESRRADLIRIGFGIVAIALAAAAGSLLVQRMMKPILALRDTVVAYGAAHLKAAAAAASSNDEIGDLAAIFESMAADISGRNRELEDIFSSIGEALVVTAADGTILSANTSCYRLCGHDESWLVGKPASALLASGVPDAATPSFVPCEHDSMLKTAKGREVPVRLSVSRLRGVQNDGWVLVARDLTERNRLEVELRQAQKMEAVGRLAGGVAHDFNNMLNIILGYASVILDGMSTDNPLRPAISEMQRAAERSAELTRQLLAFSRQETMETRVVDMSEVIEQSAKLIARVLGEDVELAIHRASSACCIEMAAGQLERVLMNLAANARDAMPRGGKLTIEARSTETHEHDPAIRTSMPPGRYVMLAVSDNGTGMDRETQDRIFEPFFTTKEQGKGTGLGLSTVFGIVLQHGGHIHVESHLGKGTTFKLYFPERLEGDSDQSDGALVASQVGGSETVLLVEDEDEIRKFEQRILSRKGYHVLTARHPEEALVLSQEHDGKIDILVTDVTMPQMSGRQLADRLCAARPAMKVLYMSGRTADVVLDHGAGDFHGAFLQKPVTPRLLASEVRAALDRSAKPYRMNFSRTQS
jgi:two-component system cell cycle sensor histidine kinase/response regulator CckA